MQNLFDMLGGGIPDERKARDGYVRTAPPRAHPQPQMQLPTGAVDAGNPVTAALAQYGPQISRMFQQAQQQRIAEQFAQAHPAATPVAQVDPGTLNLIDQRLQPQLPPGYGMMPSYAPQRDYYPTW